MSTENVNSTNQDSELDPAAETETLDQEKASAAEDQNAGADAGKAALEAEIEQLKKQLQSKEDQILRKIAEFENMRRRTNRERLQLFDDAKIKAVADFLPVFDDLGRSL
ncbi:MAG: nucleotide exchange factor GrpE, partial [Candidatus Cyclonatronum sp.]|uniref:nucleotide exchange factor GrpE n=1 Tax=Cyclonatronum sp. TaxID=3024185 RepID=UPI0025C68232